MPAKPVVCEHAVAVRLDMHESMSTCSTRFWLVHDAVSARNRNPSAVHDSSGAMGVVVTVVVAVVVADVVGVVI